MALFSAFFPPSRRIDRPFKRSLFSSSSSNSSSSSSLSSMSDSDASSAAGDASRRGSSMRESPVTLQIAECSTPRIKVRRGGKHQHERIDDELLARAQNVDGVAKFESVDSAAGKDVAAWRARQQHQQRIACITPPRDKDQVQTNNHHHAFEIPIGSSGSASSSSSSGSSSYMRGTGQARQVSSSADLQFGGTARLTALSTSSTTGPVPSMPEGEEEAENRRGERGSRSDEIDAELFPSSSRPSGIGAMLRTPPRAIQTDMSDSDACVSPRSSFTHQRCSNCDKQFVVQNTPRAMRAMAQNNSLGMDDVFCSGECRCSYIASGYEYSRAAQRAGGSARNQQSDYESFGESDSDDDMLS